MKMIPLHKTLYSKKIIDVQIEYNWFSDTHQFQDMIDCLYESTDVMIIRFTSIR